MEKISTPAGPNLKTLHGGLKGLQLTYAVQMVSTACSVQFSHSVVSDSLQPHELQHARPPCPSPTPRVHPNSCPSSRWCYPTISFSVIPFFCPQSFPASGSFPMSWLFTSDGQSIGVSALASVLAVNIQDWSSLGGTGRMSLLSCIPVFLKLASTVELVGIKYISKGWMRSLWLGATSPPWPAPTIYKTTDIKIYHYQLLKIKDRKILKVAGETWQTTYKLRIQMTVYYSSKSTEVRK